MAGDKQKVTEGASIVSTPAEPAAPVAQVCGAPVGPLSPTASVIPICRLPIGHDGAHDSQPFNLAETPKGTAS
jgi:hypothetical protein